MPRPTPEEIQRRLKEALKGSPRPERPYISPSLLKRWTIEREEAELVDVEQNPMNPRTWNPFIKDKFLDAWWILRPGLYEAYHKEYKADGYEMMSALSYEHPSLFERFWDELAVMEIEEWNPPRPRLPRR